MSIKEIIAAERWINDGPVYLAVSPRKTHNASLDRIESAVSDLAAQRDELLAKIDASKRIQLQSE